MAANIKQDWRQAIDGALTEHLPSHQAHFGARLWRSKFEEGRAAALAGYLNELSTQLQLSHRVQQGIRSSIYRIMARREESPGVPNQQFPLIAARKVTEVLICSVIRDSTEAAGMDFNNVLAKLLRKNKKLREVKTETLIQWINGHLDAGQRSEEELVEVTHAVYVACCETLGPVEGDRTLKRGVERAQKLPECREFPLARLLYPDQRR